MPPRNVSQILAEWHELAMERDEATDTEIADGLAARIEQLRREYIEGTPPEAPGTPPSRDFHGEEDPR
ncbi:MAG: hypothetical protein K0S97_698 [Chloroflexota bacterium]|jgi:hypothetical protein|nr:hypothetical protein [Chloroflexota bacterium]